MKSFKLPLASVIALTCFLECSQLLLAATVTASASAPVVDGADIAQLSGNADLGGDQGHIWSDRPVQGQSFTTLANPNGYTLSAITMRNLNNNGTAGNFKLQIGTISGTTLTPVLVDTSGTTSIVAGDYVTLTLNNPIHLAANTNYGFDWGSTGSGFVTTNDTNTSSYTGGTAYSSGSNSNPNNANLLTRSGDRVFHLDLANSSVGVAARAISVNFATGTSGAPGPYNVTGIAGVEPVGNWNNLAQTQLNPSATNAPLVDMNGNTTTASITFTAPNTWGTSAASGTGNEKLMKGYLDNMATRSVTVSGLDGAYTNQGYYVIAYGAFDSSGTFGYRITDTAGTVSEKWIKGGTNGAFTGTFIESLATSDVLAAAGGVSNYARLGPFHGTGFTFAFLDGTTGDGRSRINGFQIVRIPEPSSAALAAMGLAVLFGSARRRRMR